MIIELAKNIRERLPLVKHRTQIRRQWEAAQIVRANELRRNHRTGVPEEVVQDLSEKFGSDWIYQGSGVWAPRGN